MLGRMRGGGNLVSGGGEDGKRSCRILIDGVAIMGRGYWVDFKIV